MTTNHSEDRQARLTDPYEGGKAGQSVAPQADESGSSTVSEEETETHPPSTESRGTDWGGESTAPGGGGEITEYEADELEAWTATREARNESYGVFHVGLRVRSDLSGTDRALISQNRIEHTGEGDDAPHMQYGWGNPTPETVVAAVRSWMLDKLGYPYVPGLDCDGYPRPARTIPAERFRVFVAEEAYEALREHDHGDVADLLEATVGAVNSLPEYHPSESYRETIVTAQSVAAQAGAGSHTGALRRRERRIEATIRAKLGFSKRYGSGTPEADVEFADKDLNTLKRRLDETREERAEAESRLQKLREQLESAREDWRASIREDLPP